MNTDVSLVKNQLPAGNARLQFRLEVFQFRLEVFNVFDRANFALPTQSVFAGATQNEMPLETAGQICER